MYSTENIVLIYWFFFLKEKSFPIKFLTLKVTLKIMLFVTRRKKNISFFQVTNVYVSFTNFFIA